MGSAAPALDPQAERTSLPFVTIERSSGRIVGSTRFGSYDPLNRRIEIGWTWLARAWQRTATNTEAKYLMLTHAFERLGCVRVELKTDVLNLPSRKAMTRIGAKEEGILRKHTLMWTGRYRDTVFYSILDEEWPQVKARLETSHPPPRAVTKRKKPPGIFPGGFRYHVRPWITERTRTRS